MARIYTRTGDSGETSLGDGTRVRKSGDRVEVYGAVDELNSAVGVARAELERGAAVTDLDVRLATIQNRLFDLGAVLANPELSAGERDFGAADLEQGIDALDEDLAPLRRFILPGGCPAAAALHVARTACRRAERLAVALAQNEPVPPGALTYLNRLSDFLFTAARAANLAAGRDDVPWRREP